MAEHARQPVSQEAKRPEEAVRDVPLELAGPLSAAQPSPARALQDDLQLEINRTGHEFSMREVLSMLVVFCFAVWWALFMLVSNLV